jgi:hypothetical protein
VRTSRVFCTHAIGLNSARMKNRCLVFTRKARATEVEPDSLSFPRNPRVTHDRVQCSPSAHPGPNVDTRENEHGGSRENPKAEPVEREMNMRWRGGKKKTMGEKRLGDANQNTKTVPATPCHAETRLAVLQRNLPRDYCSQGLLGAGLAIFVLAQGMALTVVVFILWEMKTVEGNKVSACPRLWTPHEKRES